MKSESLKEIKSWLGDDGIMFFKHLKEKYGRIDTIFMEDGIPHPVHFREGMRVRNFLRELDEFKYWDTNKLDDEWVGIIEEVIK